MYPSNFLPRGAKVFGPQSCCQPIKSSCRAKANPRILPFFLVLVILFAGISAALAQTTPNFGPNVYIFNPTMSNSTIQTTLTSLANEAQFSTNRYAVLFEPGSYSVQSEVGYYESIAGLGLTPNSVSINGYLTSNQTDSNGNLTTNFWRSLENLAISSPTTLQWGVSQGAAFRRMYVSGPLELANTYCGETSGGFIADSQITGVVNSCSQQQWYTRNSSIGGFSSGVWNMVFSGVQGAPSQSFPTPPYTVLSTTPVSREKPFLYVDSGGNFNVFVPTVLTNSSGTSWSGGGLGTGYSLAISKFFIAQPSNTVVQINAALASGQNLILTPGIYQLTGSINITNPSTIVLGLGYATLVPQTGTSAITVADVDGVQVAGLLIDAGPVNSPVLFQVGNANGSRVSHQANPTSISDVFFRIGGATAGSATTSLEIDSDNVIVDNMWAWRADHGNGVGWTTNVGQHGMVVNGDNVTALGLAVEHYEQNQVVWNGNGGETIFYQSELPYDVPSQSSWMNGSVDGYSSYSVSPAVTAHKAYGLGVYSYFNQGVNIIETSAITVPVATGVTVNDAVSVFLAGSGSITYTINNVGTVAQSGAITSFVTSYGGTSGGCAAAPSIPGTPNASATSSSQINLTWGASTAGTSCTVSYNVFRSTASGFTPSSNNQVASGLSAASFADSGLAASTAYYYVVEAADGAGSSAASAQATATTQSGTCSAVPSVPGTPSANATSSSQISVTWGASTAGTSCTVSYNVFRSTTSGFTPAAGNQVASGLASTTLADSGLAASTAYYYKVEAADVVGSSAASAQATATTQAATCSAVPTVPGTPTATASSSSQISLSWGGSTAGTSCTVSYNVFRSTTSGFTPGSGNQVSSGLSVTSFADSGLAASTAYYYKVESADAAGSSAASSQATATTLPPGNLNDVVAINAGGPATGSFVADADYSGGGSATTTNTITTTGVTNAAPMAVYQSERAGVFTYTIPGLTAGTSYTVRLHFAEFYWTKAGQRVFNVSINGTSVLTNFDIFATAGAANKAVVEQFTATANSSGQIVISFTTGTADQSKVSGIEVLGTVVSPSLSINSGGAATGSFVADEDFSGGGAASTTNTITTTGVTNAAPAVVYQSERAGVFTYMLPGYAVGSSHTVTLHFAEFYWTKAGQRVFNVSIDGTTVLTNFDIFALAGANKALVEQFTTTANSSGQIVVSFSVGTADQPKVSGIQVQ